MRPSPSSRQPALAARFLPPLAALAALLAHAGQQADAQAAAETAYLAVLTVVLLSAVASLEGGPVGFHPVASGNLGATTALLVVLAAWVLPAGPLRGVVLVTLGLAAVAVAAGRRLVGGSPPAPPAAMPVPSIASLFALTLPLALVVQVLVRADRLLAPEPDWRFFAGLVGLPVVAAAAAALLVARGGRAPALTATATAALLGPGFTTLTTGGLVLLAAAVVAWRPGGEAVARRRERWAGLAVALAVAGALAAVEPAAGLLATLVALALGGRPAVSLAVAASASIAVATLPAVAAWGMDLALAATTVAPLALPVALALAARDARRWAWAAVALALLAFAAARSGVGLSLLALPCAALPLAAGGALAGYSPARRHALFVPQVVWSATLLAAVALAASYPWLRARPLASVLELLGHAPGWASWAIVATAAAAAVAGEAAVRRRSIVQGSAAPAAPSPLRVAGLATVLLFAAAVAAAPPAGRSVLLPAPVALDADRPRVELELGGRSGAGGPLVVTADTSLSHAVGVPASAPVATVRLVGAGAGAGEGERPPAVRRAMVAGAAPGATSPAVATRHDGSEGDWTLRAGSDTAEWAIRRPDVASSAAHPAPQPWLARVTEEGFFGLIFRSRAELPAAPAAARLVIERHPALPAEAVVHFHRLEVGP